jgi:EpsI family protein
MTIKRLVFLQLLLFAGLGSAFLVPTQSKTQPMGVIMDLPESLGQWSGVSQKVTEAELNGLAPDTSFARRLYSNAFGDEIVVSIVLAGDDPDNSMHRPERCLPAQGWTVVDSRTVTIKTPALPSGQLKATRLHNQRKFEDEKGNSHTLYNLNYYWFVGYTAVTPSHIDRALMDIRDRVTKGYNQRWAYVTVASNITEGLVKFGRSEGATDQMIQSLIQELFPRIVRSSVLKQQTQATEKTVTLSAQDQKRAN